LETAIPFLKKFCSRRMVVDTFRPPTNASLF